MGAAGRATRRAVVMALGCGMAASALAAPALAAPGTVGVPAGKVPRCETITVKGERWGVYIADGNVGCATAGTVLKGVLTNKGKYVNNGMSANSYILYRGWLCPYDQMGTVTCYYATKPVANPSRGIFGLSCATGAGEPACPARGES